MDRTSSPRPEPPGSDRGDAARRLSALLAELACGEPQPAHPWEAALAPGARVGRYELVRELGRGGFGVVWEARDTALGRPVAFKAVRPPAVTARVPEDRLVREADAAARLSHPNIVIVHDAGRSEHGPWIVLELLRGEPLAARLDRGPLPVADALRIAAEVASGLAHAHEHGVVHRDLTPGNVFLCDDARVKVLDFGMASAAGRRSLPGGTPAYMAPEQRRGAPEDERSDVFALGVLLHRMLVGELPFADRDAPDGGAGHRRAEALEAPELPGLGELVARMLAPDPVDRPRDAGEVALALATLRERLEALGPGAAPVVRVRSPPSLLSRGVALGIGAAVAVGLVAAAIVLAPRLRGAGAPGEPRPVVAVADLENLTGDPQLDGLSGMLVTALEGSRKLAVVPHVRMLDLARQLGPPDIARVDEALGRAVAAQVGAHALVFGTLRRLDDGGYAARLAAVDPRTSRHLFSLEERARGKGGIPDLIDRLSDAARRRLRESASDVRASRVRVAAALTSSFEAWEHYDRGERAFSAARYADAIVAYRKALAADPSFALAHFRIAYAGEFTELDPAERRAEMEAVLRALDRIPPKERLLVRALQSHLDGREEEARATYAQAVEAYPDDAQVMYAAGDHLYHLEDVAHALPLFERAVALDPLWPPALKHLVDALSDVGRFDEMHARARAWVERAPSAMAYRALADAEELLGDVEAAVRHARRAFELDEGSEFQRTALAHSLDHAERYEEAEALLRAAPDPQARSAILRIGLATTLAHQGKRRAATEVLEPLRTPPTKHRRPTLLVHLLGDDVPDRARAEARRLVAWGSTWEGLPFALALLGEGELAAAQLARVAPGPWRTVDEAAIAHLRGDAARALDLVSPFVERRDQIVAVPATWVAALAARALGRDREAVDLFQRLRREPGTTMQSWMTPRSLYLEAVALERLGDRARARERVDHLLRLWKAADPDLGLLEDARALRRRLGGGAGAAR